MGGKRIRFKGTRIYTEVLRGKEAFPLATYSPKTEKKLHISVHVHVCTWIYIRMGFPGGSKVKTSACNAGDLGLIPASGRSPGEGNGMEHTHTENSFFNDEKLKIGESE